MASKTKKRQVSALYVCLCTAADKYRLFFSLYLSHPLIVVKKWIRQRMDLTQRLCAESSAKLQRGRSSVKHESIVCMRSIVYSSRNKKRAIAKGKKKKKKKEYTQLARCFNVKGRVIKRIVPRVCVCATVCLCRSLQVFGMSIVCDCHAKQTPIEWKGKKRA
mgnify:CR=1 FL=1